MLDSEIFLAPNLNADSYRVNIQTKTVALEQKALAQAFESNNTKYARRIATVSKRIGNTRSLMQAIRNITNSNKTFCLRSRSN